MPPTAQGQKHAYLIVGNCALDLGQGLLRRGKSALGIQGGQRGRSAPGFQPMGLVGSLGGIVTRGLGTLLPLEVVNVNVQRALPPHRWYLNLRVEQACTMLADATTSIANVAYATGFADQSHFTRVFSKIVGTSPGALRRALKA